MRARIYPGVFIILVGLDGNNQLYPIAVGLCDIENTENYSWFLDMVMQNPDMKSILQDSTHTLYSDRDKGLTNSVANKTRVLHKKCLMHLIKNLKNNKR